ncbi:MAG: hypothetical protein EBQ99_03370, partial [Planctomycetes bacterium]|nr:hypothetical protein [Planctomycetota bacterium]
NALLKTMEEPPSHVKFILCTTEPHKVPATIQSRCQRFDFRPIPTGRIVEHLKAVLQQEGVQADEAAVHLVAKLGNGSMRDALSLLDRLIAAASGTLTSRLAEETLGLPDGALVAAITAAAARGDAKEGLQAAARLLESGSAVEQSLELLATRFRDLLVLLTCGEDSELVDLTPEARREAAVEARTFQSEELVHLIAVCEAALRAARTSSAPRTVFDATVARLCLHRAFEPIERAAAAGAADEKKVHEPLRAPVPAVRPAAPAASVPPPVSRAPSPPPAAGRPSPGDPVDASEAWSRLGAAATAARDIAIVETFEPVALEGNLLRLRVSGEIGAGAAFAARRPEPVQELVRRVLGPGWKVAIEAPAIPTEATAAPTHGLDASIAQHPLVREAIDAFDAVLMKVERRAASPAQGPADEGQA